MSGSVTYFVKYKQNIRKFFGQAKQLVTVLIIIIDYITQLINTHYKDTPNLFGVSIMFVWYIVIIHVIDNIPYNILFSISIHTEVEQNKH